MRKGHGVIEIRISGLAPGRHVETFTCRATDFSEPGLTDPAFSGDIHVTVELDKSDREIAAKILTSTVASLSCDACLAPVRQEITGEYSVLFRTGDPEEEGTEDDEEFRSLPQNASALDLTEDVRETLLLSLPTKVSCERYPECLEDTATTGSGDETDVARSNWQEQLKGLKHKFD